MAPVPVPAARYQVGLAEAFGGNVCGEVLFQTADCADCAFGDVRCVLAAGGGDRSNNGAQGDDFICVRPV